MTIQEEFKELFAAVTREDLESALEDADRVMRDTLGHQQAAYEGKLLLLRSVVHDLAGAFTQLNIAAEVGFNSPELASAELSRQAAFRKFEVALDRLKSAP